MKDRQVRSTRLLVIGGGILGLGIAWDACLRGLQVTLVEASHVGAGATNRYHGLLHSGGRYVLQQPDTARECASENEILRAIAPFAIDDNGGFFLQLEADPDEFIRDWIHACQSSQVKFEEIDPGTLLREEPLITRKLRRVFSVRDAAIDSFELVHSISQSILAAGGTILKGARLVELHASSDRINRAIISLSPEGKTLQVEPEMIVNASGAWAADICSMAGLELQLGLSRRTMFATGSRLVNPVLNRCRPPSDGDLLVPLRDICNFGTTDSSACSPSDLEVQKWEIDVLYEQARALIPELPSFCLLRAWSAVEGRLAATAGSQGSGQKGSGSHQIVDHELEHGKAGMLTVTGGKLTSFRLVGEQVVDRICEKIGHQAGGKTATTILNAPPMGRRPAASVDSVEPLDEGDTPKMTCECERPTKASVEFELQASGSADLDLLRRKLMLGHGPCQAAYCGYHVLTMLSGDGIDLMEQYLQFCEARWREQRPVAWGAALRQMELFRRILLDLIGVEVTG